MSSRAGEGKGGKVKSRRQAIAIALKEAGSSRYESGSHNRRNLRRAEKKETQGRTGQQEREGKSHVGTYRKRESTRAMSGRDARKTTARGRKAATARSRKADGHTRPIRVLKSAVQQAKLGREEEMQALKRLDDQARRLERMATGPSFEAFVANERDNSPLLGGRSVFGWKTDLVSCEQTKVK